MISLRSQTLETTLIRPDGNPHLARVERRIDPITGYSVRLTEERPLDAPDEDGLLPDIGPQIEATRPCPFCPENVDRETPRFPPEVTPEGQFHRARARLFPNLAPYGRHSAVCLFSGDHHIPLGSFTKSLFRDAAALCRDYLDTVARLDSDATCQVITQNILPASGGALLHPHLQVNAEEWPMTYHELLLRHPRAFLDELAATEVNGPRHLFRAGNWHFFTAFAPLGLGEIQAVIPGCTTLADLSEEDLSHWIRGLLAVYRFWHNRGRNAANMALFATTDGRHPLFLRILPRTPYRPWYRSDRSCYEVCLFESASDLLPEALATQWVSDTQT